MERLKIFKNSVLSKLEGNIQDNIYYYKEMKDNPFWVGSKLEDEGIVHFSSSSVIEWEKPTLIIGGPETDKENAKIIYSALKNLTPVQAVQPELWTYMTHIEFPEYMGKRWDLEGEDKENSNETFIKTRYFANRGGKGVVRNGIARLWWAGKWGYDEENSENHYELCDIIFDKQETYLHVSERAYNRNEDLLKEALYGIKNNDLSSDKIRILFKEINSLGSIEHLDSITREEAKEVIKEIIENMKINTKQTLGQKIKGLFTK